MHRESAVVHDSARLSLALTAWEVPGQDDITDLDRLFESVWTVDPGAVRTAAYTCAGVAAAAGSQAADDLLADDLATSVSASPDGLALAGWRTVRSPTSRSWPSADGRRDGRRPGWHCPDLRPPTGVVATLSPTATRRRGVRGGQMEATERPDRPDGSEEASRTASTRWEGGVAVVSVSGELDLATAPAVRTELEHVLRQGGEGLHVDMSDVRFVDSTGLGVLVWAWEQARAQRMELPGAEPLGHRGAGARAVGSGPDLRRRFRRILSGPSSPSGHRQGKNLSPDGRILEAEGAYRHLDPPP